MKDDTLGAYNIADLREMARRRLPKGIFEFVDRGAEDEVSLRNNRAAFERIKLKPRVLALLGCPAISALNADYLARNNLRPAPSPSS